MFAANLAYELLAITDQLVLLHLLSLNEAEHELLEVSRFLWK